MDPNLITKCKFLQRSRYFYLILFILGVFPNPIVLHTFGIKTGLEYSAKDGVGRNIQWRWRRKSFQNSKLNWILMKILDIIRKMKQPGFYMFLYSILIASILSLMSLDCTLDFIQASAIFTGNAGTNLIAFYVYMGINVFLQLGVYGLALFKASDFERFLSFTAYYDHLFSKDKDEIKEHLGKYKNSKNVAKATYVDPSVCQIWNENQDEKKNGSRNSSRIWTWSSAVFFLVCFINASSELYGTLFIINKMWFSPETCQSAGGNGGNWNGTIGNGDGTKCSTVQCFPLTLFGKGHSTMAIYMTLVIPHVWVKVSYAFVMANFDIFSKVICDRLSDISTDFKAFHYVQHQESGQQTYEKQEEMLKILKAQNNNKNNNKNKVDPLIAFDLRSMSRSQLGNDEEKTKNNNNDQTENLQIEESDSGSEIFLLKLIKTARKKIAHLKKMEELMTNSLSLILLIVTTVLLVEMVMVIHLNALVIEQLQQKFAWVYFFRSISVVCNGLKAVGQLFVMAQSGQNLNDARTELINTLQFMEFSNLKTGEDRMEKKRETFVDLRQQVQDLRQMARETTLNLSALNFFTINRKFLSSILGPILTFVVVLAQFSMSEHGGKFQNR